MRRPILIGFMAVLTIAAAAQQAGGVFGAEVGDRNQDQGRSITGQVLSKGDSPLPEAVVYLKNTKTLTIKTFIAERDGGYRFHGLSSNVDYEIYADYQGQKSSVKTISSFDSRPNITLNLHIDTR